MNYKEFIIQEELVQECHWDEHGTFYQVTGERTIYKIIGSVSKLEYGSKLSLASAKQTIDINEDRWALSEKINDSI